MTMKRFSAGLVLAAALSTVFLAAPASADGQRPTVQIKPRVQSEWLDQLRRGPAVGGASRPVVLTQAQQPYYRQRKGLLQMMFQPDRPQPQRRAGTRATAQPRLYAQPQQRLYEQRQPVMYPAPGTRAPQPRQAYRARPPAYADYPRPLHLQNRPRQAPVARAPQRATPAAIARPAPTPVRATPQRRFDPAYLPTMVDYSSEQAPGTIVIDTDNRYLYLVMEGGKAKRYGVGVGRPGFEWAGTHKVTRKAEWPTWTPPEEMKARQPGLPDRMEGGPDNPLGARALYLGSTLYRIHGSNQPWTIGRAVSSGCIRMRNEDVIDLYGRVGVGTKVVVL